MVDIVDDQRPSARVRFVLASIQRHPGSVTNLKI